MIQHAGIRKPASPMALFPVTAAAQPSQLWSRRMGLHNCDLPLPSNEPNGIASAFRARLESERPIPLLSLPSAASAFDLTSALKPPMLSPITTHMPRSATTVELSSQTPSSALSTWSQSFFGDIWTPRECDNLVSPSSLGTPIYLDHRKSFQDLATSPYSLPTEALSKSLGHTPNPALSSMDEDNMAVAVQVALQIVGRDGGYDSDDEQYCRQALQWMQDAGASGDEPGSMTGSFGRARSKMDAADKLMLRLDGDSLDSNFDAGDDGAPKRKGRARMSQEKRRRLARRKEREALMLLGLPAMPTSAPAHTTTFRLPPLITNTLATVASSNLSAEDRAAAVEAARVLVASTGLLHNSGPNSHSRTSTRTSSVDLMDRRQASAPNLRAMTSSGSVDFKSARFSVPMPSPWGESEHMAFKFPIGDADSNSDHSCRGMLANLPTPIFGAPLSSSSHGMPSLSRGGSVASSPAGTPLQTPDNFMVPLPPAPFSVDATLSSGRKLQQPGGGANFQPDQMGYSAFGAHPGVKVPNVRVMPPTPHNKAAYNGMTPLRVSATDATLGLDTRQSPRKSRSGSLCGEDPWSTYPSGLSRPPTLKRSTGSFAAQTHAGVIGGPRQIGTGTDSGFIKAPTQSSLNGVTGTPPRPRSQTTYDDSWRGPQQAIPRHSFQLGPAPRTLQQQSMAGGPLPQRDYFTNGAGNSGTSDRSMGPPLFRPARSSSSAAAAAAPTTSVSQFPSFSMPAGVPSSAGLGGSLNGPNHARPAFPSVNTMMGRSNESGSYKTSFAGGAGPARPPSPPRYSLSSALGIQLKMGGPLDS
ncbi:hypothetical protein V8E36_002076 [Tilletia maclaganii]